MLEKQIIGIYYIYYLLTFKYILLLLQTNYAIVLSKMDSESWLK